MKTAKELFERLQNDAEFNEEFGKAVQAKKEAGAKNYYETMLPTAEEYGYALSKEEMDEFLDSKSEVLSEEELGKVAGGTSCLPATVSITVVISTASAIASVTVSMETTKD